MFHENGPTQERSSRGSHISLTGRLPSVVRGSTRFSYVQLGNSRWGMYTPGRTPYNPEPATRTRLHRPGLGWIPFRSPLLGESRLISFPPGTEMFQFPGLSRRTYVFSAPYRRITSGGFPHSGIRGSQAIQRLLAAYRSRSRPSSTPGAKASTVCP